MPRNNTIVDAVIGPTCCSKSATAIRLAERFDCPIIVADRLQCFSDIPITSSRETGKTANRFRYIAERRLAAGDYPADVAFADLQRLTQKLSEEYDQLVLEGGSTSLVRRIAEHGLNADLNVTIVLPDNPGRHWHRLRERALSMVAPADGSVSLLDELRDAWSIVDQRALVASVNGFEAVLSWCSLHQIDPTELSPAKLEDHQIWDIASAIATTHLDHVIEQQTFFLKLFERHRWPISVVDIEGNPKAGQIPTNGLIPTDASGTRVEKKVTVYCGSSAGDDPRFAAAAEKLGQHLAESKVTVVYGGSNIGLMKHVADSALAVGGRVYGVIPQKMIDYGVAHTNLTSLEVTDTLHDRKMCMASMADAFIALPGGIGTLEELLETLAWAQLGIHRKICMVINIGGFFEPLRGLMANLIERKFLDQEASENLIVVDTVDQAIELLRVKWQEQSS